MTKKKHYIKLASTITFAELKDWAQETADEYTEQEENVFAAKVMTHLLVKIFDALEKRNAAKKKEIENVSST